MSLIACELEDSEDFLDLVDDVNFFLDGYVVNVPQLDGLDQYEHATETLTLAVKGDSAAEAIENLTRLWQILDRATRWWKGERDLVPVVFRTRAQGSALASPLEALCLGWAQDSQAMRLPPTVLMDAGRYIIPNITITILRTSWLLGSEVSSQQINILPDSDFRHGYWTFTTGAGSITVQELTATPDGVVPNYGLGAKVFQNFSGVYGDNYRESDQTITVIPGEQLTFSFDFACAGGVTASSCYLRFQGPLSFSQYVLIPLGTLSQIWQRRSITVTVPAGANRVLLRFGVGSNAGWWLAISGMQLERSGSATSWQPSSIGDNPAVLTATFAGSFLQRSPASIALAGFGQATTPTIAASWMIVSDKPANMHIVDWPGSGALVASPFSSVSDTTNRAYGGTVQRFTPANTNKILAGSGTLPSGMKGEVAALIFARNNSSSTSFIVSLKLKGSGINQETDVGVVTPYTSSAAPKIIPLPGVVNDYGHESFELYLQATAAVGSLDIDAIVFVRISPATTILQIEAIDVAGALNASALASLAVQSRNLTHHRPFVGAINNLFTTDVAVATPHGDTQLVSRGTQIAVLWLAPYNAFWRHVDDGTSGDPTTRLQLSATRQPANLTPQ